MLSFLIQNLVLFMLFLLALIFIVIFIDSLISIKNKINDSKFWKQYRGVYVLAKIVRNDKKNEIYYFDTVTETMSSASSSIQNVIKFENQDQALKFLLKNYTEGMFILKI